MTIIDANPKRRTITGIILPYDEPGATTAGRITFNRGSLRIPNDLSSVKLLRDHSTHGGGPVAVMSRWWVDAIDGGGIGVYADFTVPATPDGDLALIEAQSVRDCFSIEAVPLTRNGPYITDSVLRKVAMVPIPAYERARVTMVYAERADELILAENTTAAGQPAPAPAPAWRAKNAASGRSAP